MVFEFSDRRIILFQIELRIVFEFSGRRLILMTYESDINSNFSVHSFIHTIV